MSLRCIGAAFLTLLLPVLAAGQDTLILPGDQEPVLRLEPGGPSSLVTGLAFSPDGETLYDAGRDKVVRVWTRKPPGGSFGLVERATYRIPIGPGLGGVINALAVSSGGNWLAVAGNGIIRGGSGFRQTGLMLPAPARSETMRLDQGLIYVFNTRNDPPTVRILRGHQGPVLSLAFAPDQKGKPPLLISTARERDRIGAVRLWDVEHEAYLDGLWDLPKPEAKPALVLWHTGPGRKQLRAAIAWGDGALRLWDVESDHGHPTTVSDGKNNDTLALLSPPSATAPPRFLSGSFQGRQGQLTTWETRRETAPPVEVGPRLTFPPAGALRDFPRAIALIADRPGGRPHHAAVVVMRVPAIGSRQDIPREVDLELVDLMDGRFGTVTSRVPLWQVEDQLASLPILAVDPRGRSLAIAGNAAREILVFTIADLLKGRASPQRLRGEGMRLDEVAFMKKGADWGLRIRERSRDHPGAAGLPEERDLIFDFTRRRLTDDRAGWQEDAPDLDGWQAAVVPGALDRTGRTIPSSLTVSKGGGLGHRIALLPGQVVTASALLPPRPPRREPIVAIAFEERGEPGLGLYDGLTGAQLRQFIGHSERVRCLAFSRDGLRLVSTANDRTVCVWSLSDLDQTLGKRGSIAGLVVNAVNGRLVVAGLDPGKNPAFARVDLRESDVILGTVSAGTLRPLASMIDFYQELWLIEPGQSVSIRTDRPGRGPADVTLPIGQATDERKPLLSLFVKVGKTPEDRKWIGWSPLGPFDSSDRDTDKLLGWHYNVGNPREPTRFSTVDQDLGFRRPGHLKLLIERLVPELEPPPQPVRRPKMSLSFVPGGEIDRQGRLLMRQTPSKLSITFLEQDMNDETIESIQWNVDGSPWSRMSSSNGRVYSADIPRRPWPRGEHVVRVSLRTREAMPQEFTVESRLRLQAPPPSLVQPWPPKDLVVDHEDFRFQAQEVPAGGHALFRIVHLASTGDRQEFKNIQSDARFQIDFPLKLKPDRNTIELDAVNQNPLPGFEEYESTKFPSLEVNYKRSPALKPEITLENLFSVRRGSESGPIPSMDWRMPIIVEAGRVRIKAKIKARGIEKLARAEWSDGSPRVHKLDRFVPDLAPSFDVSEVLALTPGLQTFRLRAWSGDSEAEEARFTIDYRPPLPEFGQVTYDPADPVVYQGQDGGPRRINLKAELLAPDDPRPFHATVLVNGKERGELPTIDGSGSHLAAEVGLEPGDNSIEVRLSNAWHEPSFTDPHCVTYRRPPYNIVVTSPVVGAEPFIDIAATADTAEDLPLTQVQIEVEGGEPGVRAKRIHPAQFRREGLSWAISARGVPIEPKRNLVTVRAWNRDGLCRVPGERAVNFKAPLAFKKPTVKILSPGDNTTVSTSSLALEFRVESSSPLKSVTLVRLRSSSDRSIVFAPDVANTVRKPEGGYEYRAAPIVTLGHYENQFLVAAVNAGGEQTSAPVVVSYKPPPVHVIVDRFVPKDGEEASVAPRFQKNDPSTFVARLRTARAVMHGRVVWPDAETKPQKHSGRVRVHVNGSCQSDFPIQAPPGPELEARFEAPILFDSEDNRVLINLPRLAREARDCLDFHVACQTPDTGQRLHLLIIGVGVDDESALRDRALRALQGDLLPNSTSKFRTPAFSDGIIYGPLTESISDVKVRFQLGQILTEIEQSKARLKPPKEVVIVYYQGGEWFKDGKSNLRLGTGRRRGMTDDGIATDDLAGFFARAPGVQLILLDVTRSSSIPAAPVLLSRPDPVRPDESASGFLRFSWLTPDLGGRIEPPPDEARLLTVLGAAMPRASTMSDLVSGIAKKHEQLKEIYPGLLYEPHIPDDLAGLIVGRP